MKANISLALLALIAVGLVAGCGGGSKVKTAKLDASDVAVVGTTHVTQTQFDQLMSNGEQTYKSEGQSWPKQGTAQYAQLKSQAVTALVQQAMQHEQAAEHGIDNTPKKVAAKVKVTDAKINQYFKQNASQFPDAAASRQLRLILVK